MVVIGGEEGGGGDGDGVVVMMMMMEHRASKQAEHKYPRGKKEGCCFPPVVLLGRKEISNLSPKNKMHAK